MGLLVRSGGRDSSGSTMGLYVRVWGGCMIGPRIDCLIGYLAVLLRVFG